MVNIQVNKAQYVSVSCSLVLDHDGVMKWKFKHKLIQKHVCILYFHVTMFFLYEIVKIFLRMNAME